MKKPGIHKAIRKLGSPAKLAHAINQINPKRKCLRQQVEHWQNTGVPTDSWVVDISRASGVSVEDLRPDLYPPLTKAQIAEIGSALLEADAGDFASDAEVKKLFKRFDDIRFGIADPDVELAKERQKQLKSGEVQAIRVNPEDL